MVCATNKATDQPAQTQSDLSLCWSQEYSLSVKLLTEYHFEFLSLKVGCTGSSESTLLKIPHCWKSLVAAHFFKVCFGTDYMLTINYSVISVRWVGVGQARDSIIELF